MPVVAGAAGLARAVDDAVIAFDVDEFRCDPHTGLGQGWNVTASGRSRRCAEPAGLSELLLTWSGDGSATLRWTRE